MIILAAAVFICGLTKGRRGLQRSKYSFDTAVDTGHIRPISVVSQQHTNPNDTDMVVSPWGVHPHILPGARGAMGMPYMTSVQTHAHAGGQSLPPILTTTPHVQFATPGVFDIGTTTSPTFSHGSHQGTMPSTINPSFNNAMPPSPCASISTASSHYHREDIISPYISPPPPTSFRSLDRSRKIVRGTRGTGSPSAGSSHDSSEDIPPSPHRRMNPPPYTARVGLNEQQAVAPSRRSSDQRKR